MLPIYASAAFPALPTSTSTSLPTPTPTPWATALQLPSLCFTKFHFSSVRFGFVFVSSSAAWHKRNEWYEKGQRGGGGAVAAGGVVGWQNFTSSMASIYLSGFKRRLLIVLAECFPFLSPSLRTHIESHEQCNKLCLNIIYESLVLFCITYSSFYMFYN